MTATLADVENRNALGGALVVTNEGSTFCAGANLKERSSTPGAKGGMGSFEDLLIAIQHSPTPIVGRIAGHVVGGGNGLTLAYGVSDLWWPVRMLRIAPVSAEMILNHVAQHSLGLPRSY
jgi:enoyl-CoA hydratase/carnithine racemase